ncbi:MAG: TrkH family potassium uptake protein [Bacilli bacterium]|jgi:Trk-type K+ transport system membrane component|nr:TrkH family potassium uptake protein [Bacilli bacterium]
MFKEKLYTFFFGKKNKNISYRRRIARWYITTILLGAILLYLPLTHNNGGLISVIDSFFISTSAFSITGLTTVNISETFNWFGHLIIVILIQIGAVGLMSIKALILVLVNRKITTTDRMMIHTEHKQTSTAGMVRLVKDAVLIMLSVQLIFTFILSIHMMITYQYNFFEALWFSYFHMTAALTNAGFDLTGNSLYSFSNDYLLQIYFMIVIIIGGLGFPVLIDLKRFFISKKNKERFRFSLFSKISLVTYFVVLLVGLLFIIISDYNYLFNDVGGIKGFFIALFQVVSSRSSGLATIDIHNFNSASQFMITILMFIGAAPASTGGGIRTTTLAIIVLYLIHFASNKKDVEAFNRRIPNATIFNSFVSVLVAMTMVNFASLLILLLNKDLSFLDIIFEVCSAFGTTGFSLGITSSLDSVGKIIIALLMIIGQMGITNTLLIISKNKEDDDLIKYPEENIAIG